MSLSHKGEIDRRNTLADVASILAEHVHCFGGDIESLMEDIQRDSQEQLWDLQDDAAQERAIEEQAEREGLRY